MFHVIFVRPKVLQCFLSKGKNVCRMVEPGFSVSPEPDMMAAS